MSVSAYDHVPTLVAPDGKPRIRELLQHPAASSHIVQFYEDEAALVENVVAFLAAGIRAGDPVIVIATAEHRAAFSEGLRRQGIIISDERMISMLDARETLGAFMDAELPNWDRFVEVIGGALAGKLAHSRGRSVRAYGEMVDLLWRDGKRDAAIRLEGFWNDLAQVHSFSLFCAYVMDNFLKATDAEAFREVCCAHSHVIPAERVVVLDVGDDRLHAFSELQKRARALQQEVDHRRELERALREALARETAMRERAEEAVRVADVFAGMLGHDLRNPLGTISMGANTIARSNLGERPTRAATRIVSAAERMGRMIDQLLDYTRIRMAGGIELERTRVELAEICSRVKEEVEASHPQCTIALRTAGNTDGMWDRDRLFQVFSNLVGNAVTHGTAGCEVSIESDGRDAGNVVVLVRNAGAVDPQVLPGIFDPLRSGKKRHNARGLGLGLFIARQIVIGHGGEIAITSSEADGTLVRVTLPRAVASS